MAGSEQSSGWQSYHETGLYTEFNTVFSPACLDFQPHFSAQDIATSFEGTSFNLRPLAERETGPYQQGRSPEHMVLPDVTRQILGQYEKPQSLPRQRSRYRLRQSLNRAESTAATSGEQLYDLNSLPLERWRNSPPQDEAVSLSAIYGAMQSYPHHVPQPGGQSYDNNIGSLQDYAGPSSTASRDSGASSSSALSGTSDLSDASSKSYRIPAKKSRRRPRVTAKRRNGGSNMADRIFKCTFCCDAFRHKYDWVRHEKSVHLSLESWSCTPNGALVTRPQTGRVHCAYCDLLNPKPDHVDSHNHHACHNNPDIRRVFRRKDHLIQHLRHVHGVDTVPLMDDWKLETMTVVSRCGFCNAELMTWEQRADHLTEHFRAGKTMLNWQGEHGFDAAVASQVSNALPPFLIGAESLAPVPFSATNPASIDHFRQISSQMSEFIQETSTQAGECQEADLITDTNLPAVPRTDIQDTTSRLPQDTVAFIDILTRHLGRFAREQMAAGQVPTDEMFQRESRRLIYGDADDTWNITVADNADWLRSFRQQNA
ncbi:hypothetical protein BU24DRAFT_262493 [Aaosphaeria arxii CBS 175.79]|uniref:C2H2-type domain-containing protein n=1 Tax=Aaosphaeria arxii CBS 175.79 TaxID=1450172 RepID=A0A6A5XJG0_9PLEO|nr:uncharacterized protein BU24DRAFT_262493 [Aaosphaeria arxii CBS 175.79]KAF2013006.1 hypothetical protein BU24DRAFT_262493 [Aaosphaeria arxii CBS 175.79]